MIFLLLHCKNKKEISFMYQLNQKKKINLQTPLIEIIHHINSFVNDSAFSFLNNSCY